MRLLAWETFSTGRPQATRAAGAPNTVRGDAERGTRVLADETCNLFDDLSGAFGSGHSGARLKAVGVSQKREAVGEPRG